MQRKMIVLIAALAATLGLSLAAVLTAAPAGAAPVPQAIAAPAVAPALAPAAAPALPAGNGTSNFYYSRSCGVNLNLGSWAECSWTNYDNGANQTIHWATRTSGWAIKWEIYVNGVLRKSGSGASSGYLSAPGWGKVIVLYRAWVPGYNATNCSQSAP